MHDTEGAEAAHKTSMGLPAIRVRHLLVNKTQNSMRNYLCDYTVFEALRKTAPQLNRRTKPVVFRTGVHVPLQEHIQGVLGVFTVEMGTDLASVDTQAHFLHREARIARVELMNLVCAQLQIPTTRTSYAALGNLSWKFGQVIS